MGCCYSQEEEYEARPVPTVRRPTSTATRSPNYFDAYYEPYRETTTYSYRSVPIHNQVSKPNVRAVVVKPTPAFKPKPGALYGEYKCRCGYFWVSRLSWRDKYQQCKRCKQYVRPKNQRELRPSDFTRSDNDEGLEHPQELCEMCKDVGGYCGRYK